MLEISTFRNATPMIVLLVLGACSSVTSGCPDEQPARTLDSGATDSQSLFYESAPWTGPLDSFPARSELIFQHRLGLTPQIVMTYLSFSKNGTADTDVAENAGNQGLIECVDSEIIRIRNDTCEGGFYIRVVAMATPNARAESHCR